MGDQFGAAADPVRGQTRARLGELRGALLRLHKALLEAERSAYERGRGRIGGGGEFLQLVINDPWFAWLRPVSELIVRIDELTEPGEGSSEEAAQGVLKQAGALFRPREGGGEFGKRYREAMQQSPDVVLAHAQVWKLLTAGTPPKPMSEAEVDENLSETFPASDPPSWTLGTDHRAGAARGEGGGAETTRRDDDQ